MWAIFASASRFGLTLGLFVMGNFTEHSQGFFFLLGTFVWPSSVVAALYVSEFFFLALGHVTTLWQLAFCYPLKSDPPPLWKLGIFPAPPSSRESSLLSSRVRV